MNHLVDFLQSEQFFAFIMACLIFLITILLVVKKRIGFVIAFLLLLFSLAVGLLINNQSAFEHFLTTYNSSHVSKGDVGAQDAFRKQMLQAVEDLKGEVKTEKENLQQVVKQVQEIVSSIDAQKQKIQQFIEETRERLKVDFSPKSSETGPQKP